MVGVGLATVVVTGLTATLTIPSSSAHDDADTPKMGYVWKADYFTPQGKNDDKANGVRVYLSSPRHSDSGHRGECEDGLDENINGRKWNFMAANADFHGGKKSHKRNLHARGYTVLVSPNSRDNGYLNNREQSQNWGADLHIITHSNASVGCPGSASYLWLGYNQSNDLSLARALGDALDPQNPGGVTYQQRTELAELSTNAPLGDAYVEIAFHDNPAAQLWMRTKMRFATWAVGLGVDRYLKYPTRAVTPATLERVPGFGTSGADVDRDNQVAAYLTWKREQTVGSCMQKANFRYAPDLGLFPMSASMDFDVARTSTRSVPGARINARVVSGLDDGGRNEYWQALVGESESDVEAADEHGTEDGAVARTNPRIVAPDFLSGGCRGRARAETPDVWKLRNGLETAFSRARAQADESDRVVAARRTYSECVQRIVGHSVPGLATDGEAALESAAVDGGVDEADAVQADLACTGPLNSARATAYGTAAQAVVAAHGKALAKQRRVFDRTYQASRTDAGFAAAVAGQIG